MLLLLGALLGCDPCPDPVEIHDAFGRLPHGAAAELRQAHEAFLAASGTDAACLTDVTVLDPTLGPHTDAPWKWGRHATVSATEAERHQRFLQCLLLDEAFDHSGAAPEWFGPDSRLTFGQVCTWATPNLAWRDEIRAACGADQLDARDAYMADHVFPFADQGRVDGPLSAENEPDRDFPLEWDHVAGAPAGDRLLLVVGIAAEPTAGDRFRTVQVRLFDGETRSSELVMEHERRDVGEYTTWDAVGGPHGAIVQSRRGWGDEAERNTWWVSAEGVVSALPDVDIGEHSFGARVTTATTLWRWDGWYWSAPLVAVDLETGIETAYDSPLPDWGNEVLIGGIQPVEDGLWVERYDAEVEVDHDFITIWTRSYDSYHLAPGTGPGTETWTKTAQDLHILDAGVVGDRYVVGSTFSDAGRALVAWDTRDHQLLVSDGACLGDDYPPWVTTDGRAWELWSRYDPETRQTAERWFETIAVDLP